MTTCGPARWPGSRRPWTRSRLRRRRRPGGGRLQRLPGPDRGRAAARRPAEEPAAAVRLRPGPAAGHLGVLGPHPLGAGRHRAGGAGQPLLGQLRLRRRDTRGAAGRGPGRPALRRSRRKQVHGTRSMEIRWN